MGQLGVKTIDKLQKYAVYKHNPKDMGFSPQMQLRIMIADQLYQAYATGRVQMYQRPIKVVREIAKRVYRSLLSAAISDEYSAYLVRECGLTETSVRAMGELTNDVEAYEVLRANWGVDTSHHAKAVCEETAYSLIEMGSKNGDSRALAAGYDRLSKLHNDFQEKAEDLAHTAATEIDFIADVQLVRPDAENLSRAEIEAFKKKYGAYIDKGGIEDMVQTEDGVYEVAGERDAEDEEDDYFKMKEKEILGNG